MADTIQTLIRMQQQVLDDLRLDLVRLEDRDAQYVENLRILEERLVSESNLARQNPLLQAGYAAFATRARQLRKQVEHARVQLAREIDGLRDEMADHFAEKKKLEFVKEAQQVRHKKWLHDQEAKDMDEIGSMIDFFRTKHTKERA